jgi:crotonobetainyl-CoA:carnitine CoA-transferase CaiB-like acyl-CoA transferase
MEGGAMRLLDGIRVIDLGSYITGPLATMLLGEYGADVIKVERPGGDPFRAFAGGNYSPHFQAHNRNKRSVVLDYAQPDGRQTLLRLLDGADVVVMNSRPGVAERLGLGWDELHARNPGLLYCAITGFGQDGPHAHRAAFDNVGQAVSGWMSRFRTGNDPRVPGPAVSDAATGCYATMGILAALVDRTRTGRGRRIDLSMIEATIALGAEPVGQYLATGKVQPVFQRAAMSQSYNVSCADGKRIGLHLSSPDKFWQALCRVLGRGDWIEAYPTRMDRVRAYEVLAEMLSGAFGTRPRGEWLPLLEAEDVPFSPENTLDELASDPQVAHLDVFYTVDHPKYGLIRAPHRAVRVDGCRDVGARPPPDLGEHTEEVLAELRADLL